MLLDDIEDSNSVEHFDKTCQQMLNKIFTITIKSVKHWKEKDSSFEYDSLRFHQTLEFECLCDDFLPPVWQNVIPVVYYFFNPWAACIQNGSEMHWLNHRRQELKRYSRKKDNACVSPIKENSEVNQFLGWSIFSAKTQFKSVSDEACLELLSAMMVLERDIDDQYIEKYYDTHMSLLNRGGLTLVNTKFFE